MIILVAEYLNLLCISSIEQKKRENVKNSEGESGVLGTCQDLC